MLLLRDPFLRLSWPPFPCRALHPLPDKISSPKKGFWDPDSLEKLLPRGICTASNTLNYLMGLSLQFRGASVLTGGQPLIQEQGHPNQVVSVETRPVCTPPASLHIHSPFSALSPKLSWPGLPRGLSQCHWCWSPVQPGLKPPPGRSPVPTASSQPSPGSTEGLQAVIPSL